MFLGEEDINYYNLSIFQFFWGPDLFFQIILIPTFFKYRFMHSKFNGFTLNRFEKQNRFNNCMLKQSILKYL